MDWSTPPLLPSPLQLPYPSSPGDLWQNPIALSSCGRFFHAGARLFSSPPVSEASRRRREGRAAKLKTVLCPLIEVTVTEWLFHSFCSCCNMSSPVLGLHQFSFHLMFWPESITWWSLDWKSSEEASPYLWVNVLSKWSRFRWALRFTTVWSSSDTPVDIRGQLECSSAVLQIYWRWGQTSSDRLLVFIPTWIA